MRNPVGSWRPLLARAALATVALLVACGRDGSPAAHPPLESASLPVASSSAAPAEAAAPAPAVSATSVTLTGAAQGCGNVFLFGATASGTKIVTVRVDVKALGMKPGAKRAFDLAERGPAVVALEVYGTKPKGEVHCTDERYGDERPTETLTPTSGTLELELLPRASATAAGTYRATASLRNVQFRAKDGSVVTLTHASFADVAVGWLPG